MKQRLMIALLVATGFCLAAHAADEGRSGGITLLRGMGARPAGFGEAFAAVSGDIQSIGVNPAGLATITEPALSATYLNGIVDDSFGIVHYAHRLGFGSLFAGAAYFDGGDIELNLSGGVQETRKAQQDQVGLVGFAVGADTPISFGATAKMYKFELAEEAKADGVAGDVGLVWRTPLKGFSIGGSFQNLGSDFKYETESESLPQASRAGAAYELDFQDFSKLKKIPYRALIVADAINVKDQDGAFAAGLELQADMEVSDYSGTAALRGGYNSGSESVSVGIGFRLANVFLDYVLNLLQDELDEVHRVTLGWKFSSK